MTVKQRPIGSAKIRRAYAFLVEAERNGRIFTREDLVLASGWTDKTTRANLPKKLGRYVSRVDGGYHCSGILDLREESFCRLFSQNVMLASDPHRPLLGAKVEELVQKARESVLAAVQHYNNPTAVFRSGNYIVLMIIGYTALFHAIFERDGIDYIERKSDDMPKLTPDGEEYLWDALRCARHYAQLYGDRYEKGILVAMAKNLEFIFPIRHKIEHRHMPELDVDICGHCQAMLMNFEQILTQEFTPYYSLNSSLSLALQFSTRRSPEAITSLKRFQSAEYQQLRQYIAHFHASLPDDILGNLAFEFRVWLIQKPANRAQSSDLSIEFIHTDQLSDEQRIELQQALVAIKMVKTDRLIDPSTVCTLWESQVISSLLFWKTANPPDIKNTAIPRDKIGTTLVILDGQQRLTTLYLLTRGSIPPYYTADDIKNDPRNLYFDLDSGDVQYYQPTRMQKNLPGLQSPSALRTRRRSSISQSRNWHPGRIRSKLPSATAIT